MQDQLAAKGFATFLPMVDAWCRRGGIRRRTRMPLFGGYLFLRHAIDRAGYLEIYKARGLVRILGERWDSLAVVPESEMEAVQTVLRSRLPLQPHPYIREGQRVRIKRGPLEGLEGILLRGSPKTGLLVVSVELLQRSVAVHLDCTALEAVT